MERVKKDVIKDEAAASEGAGRERTPRGGNRTLQDQTQELFTPPSAPITLSARDCLARQPPDADKLLWRAVLTAPDTLASVPLGETPNNFSCCTEGGVDSKRSDVGCASGSPKDHESPGISV